MQSKGLSRVFSNTTVQKHLWRTVWRFLKKLEIELPYNPAIPLLGVHTMEQTLKRSRKLARVLVSALGPIILEGIPLPFISQTMPWNLKYLIEKFLIH